MIYDLSWQSLAPNLIINNTALPLAAGNRLSFTVSNTRHCIGYSTFKQGRRVSCPSGLEVSSGKNAQCDFCRKRDASFTAKTGYGFSQEAADLLNTKHALYLAYFAKDIVKVGVTLWDRREVRVSEQGALACMFIAQGNGTAMRNLERQIHTRVGLTEWVRLDTKLANLCSSQPTETIALSHIQKAYTSVISEVQSTALIDEPDFHYLFPRYQIQSDVYISAIESVRDVQGGAHLAGRVDGIYGKVLLLRVRSNILAINTQLLIGYDATFDSQDNDFASSVDKQSLAVNRQQSLFEEV